MEQNQMVLPEWYESSKGPQLSLTIKMIAGLLLPAAKDILGIEIGSDTVDSLVDASLIIIFGIGILYAHIRSKKILVGKIAEQAKIMGSIKDKTREC